MAEGCLLGCAVGCSDGKTEGIAEGRPLGCDEGSSETEGTSEGRPLGAALADGAVEGAALGVKDALGSTHVRDPASSSTYESTCRSATSAITILSVFHPSSPGPGARGAPRAASPAVKPSASMIPYRPSP